MDKAALIILTGGMPSKRVVSGSIPLYRVMIKRLLAVMLKEEPFSFHFLSQVWGNGYARDKLFNRMKEASVKARLEKSR